MSTWESWKNPIHCQLRWVFHTVPPLGAHKPQARAFVAPEMTSKMSHRKGHRVLLIDAGSYSRAEASKLTQAWIGVGASEGKLANRSRPVNLLKSMCPARARDPCQERSLQTGTVSHGRRYNALATSCFTTGQHKRYPASPRLQVITLRESAR